MVEVDPCLRTLYVRVDAVGQAALPLEPPPGPQATLRRSDVVPWARGGPWPGGGRARGFDRAAPPPRRAAGPQRPTREPGNRPRRAAARGLGGLVSAAWGALGGPARRR
jgi:hypothetical protein